MAESRKIIRVFLASPSDLGGERLAVRDVVDEINDNLADFFGFQIELIGWEDTVSRHGRPQELINQDLDRCEFFIGMMWKKWGTPTGNVDYTSGFEEEFERSLDRRNRTAKPEISMFFKHVPTHFMEDKGPDLLKVLQFKKDLTDKRSLLYQEFGDEDGIKSLVRKCLIQYVIELKEAEEAAREEDVGSKRAGADSGPSKSRDRSSPLSEQGFAFLSDLLERMRGRDSLDELNACDIARFRLLSNSISMSGNDARSIGVHDVNIVFANRDSLDLGKLEVSNLTRAGFEYLQSENVPLWHWFAKSNGQKMAIGFSAFGADDDEKVGAIQVLDWLGIQIPKSGEPSRDHIFSRWFADGSSNKVRNAAIGYIARNGQQSEFHYVSDEYERNDSNTTRRALEGMINMAARFSGTRAAAKLIVQKQFDSINEEILLQALSGLVELDAQDLRMGISHQNSKVRLSVLNELDDRSELADDELQIFLADDDADVRFSALIALNARKGPVATSDAKRLLVKPQKQRGLGLLSQSFPSDVEGSKRFEEYQIRRLLEKSEKELLGLANEAFIYDDDSYFVLVEKYFGKWGDDLRKNIDDRFDSFFDERMKRFEKADPESKHRDTIERLQGLKETIQSDLVRRGLSVLARKKNANDLRRIRNSVTTGINDTTVEDAEYVGKLGSWEDVEPLAKSKSYSEGRNALAIFSDDSVIDAKAKAIYQICRDDLPRLFKMDISPRLSAKIIRMASKSAYVQLSNEDLLFLFNNNSDELRRVASKKAVSMLPVKRLRELLTAYVDSDQYRYYNVIHWLDLGVSMSRKEARKVIQSTS